MTTLSIIQVNIEIIFAISVCAVSIVLIIKYKSLFDNVFIIIDKLLHLL